MILKIHSRLIEIKGARGKLVNLAHRAVFVYLVFSYHQNSYRFKFFMTQQVTCLFSNDLKQLSGKYSLFQVKLKMNKIVGRPLHCRSFYDSSLI